MTTIRLATTTTRSSQQHGGEGSDRELPHAEPRPRSGSTGTSYDDAPDKVEDASRDPASTYTGVEEPRAIVYVKEYAASSISFEIKCYIEDYDRRP
jgi:hypothetical protein